MRGEIKLLLDPTEENQRMVWVRCFSRMTKARAGTSSCEVKVRRKNAILAAEGETVGLNGASASFYKPSEGDNGFLCTPN